jgi:hypothetical protein
MLGRNKEELKKIRRGACRAQAYASPEAAVLTKVFALLMDDHLNEVAYDADLAGLSFGMRSTTSGFLVSFSGHAPAPPCLQLRFALLLSYETVWCLAGAWTVPACVARLICAVFFRGLQRLTGVLATSVLSPA